MLTPYKWLIDYIEKKEDLDTLCQRMKDTGNAIESISGTSAIKNVVVAKIEKIEKHPDADKLLICQVNIGEQVVQIVTGASNVFEGAVVPAALIGAELPDGTKIKKGKLRGVLSEGMLCSGEELLLKEEDYEGAGEYGILILKKGEKVGDNIVDALGLNDAVLEFEVGANRPDCLSIMGLAKEAAAALGTKFIAPDMSYSDCGEDVNDYIKVTVHDKDLCPRYMAAAIKDVKIEPSPAWMQKRLMAAGVRPISNMVDITNYVMLETGQPLHAFDLSDLENNEINVRRAAKDEKIVTLDGKERELNENVLLICDGVKPVGIAGIMGGLNSEIKDTTKTVIIESAKFAYGNIRQSARFLGMATEASMRFSKGVSASTSEIALKRVLNLVEKLGAGKVVKGTVDLLYEDIQPKVIVSSVERINALLGSEISGEKMCEILNALELESKLNGDELTTTVPNIRADIEREADIAEEVARIFGYDNIPAKPLVLSVARGKMSKGEIVKQRLKQLLVDSGYFEAITYSFTSRALQETVIGDKVDNAIKIINPLGEDKSIMRQTGVADMLTVVATNLNQKAQNIKVFEMGKTYVAKQLPLSALPEENEYVCLAATHCDFFDLKGVVENMLDMCGTQARFSQSDDMALNPARAAKIEVNGKQIGIIGEVAKDVAAKFGIDEKVYVAEIMLKSLFKSAGKAKKYEKLSKFPPLLRDLAFVVDYDICQQDVADVIMKSGGKMLSSVEIFDVYAGKNLGEDKKSLAFSLVFKSEEKTLNDKDIEKNIDNIIAQVEARLGGQLRK